MANTFIPLQWNNLENFHDDEFFGARRTWIPEGGGWVYRFPLGGGCEGASMVFIPSIEVWAQALNKTPSDAARVVSDFKNAQHTRQDVPVAPHRRR